MGNQQLSSEEKELWLTCEDIPKYEISNIGRVRNKRTKKLSCIRKEELGYLSFRYISEGKARNYKVHRLVAKAFIDNPENKPEVNHKDGCKDNNAAYNLEWVTRRENIIHGHITGLYNQKGSNNGRSKLSEEQVHLICQWFELSKENTPTKATEIFSISIQQASKIRCGISRKHISSLYNITPINNTSKKVQRL